MPERAIFLDRDNTIIEDKEGYIGDPARVRLLPGAATAIASLRRLGYRIIIASNQSGVARGYFSEEDVEAVNQEMCRQLREQAGAVIDASYYCPYHPEGALAEYRQEHDWRKPRCGMLKQAAQDFDLDLAQCWMIGDSPRDIACGASAGCRTILIKDPEHPDQESPTDASVSPNFIVKSLADAARIVAREKSNPNPDPVPVPLGVDTAPPPAAAEEPAAAPSPATAPAVDEAALAERLATAMQRAIPRPESLKPVLEDIARQLRQQQRHVESDNPGLQLAAVLVQLAAIFFAVMAVWGIVTAGPLNLPNWYAQTQSLLRSALWLLGAGLLQGFTIALLLMARRR